MKYFLYSILSVLFLFLQLYLADSFSIFSVLPNFLIPLVIFVNLDNNLGFTSILTFFIALGFDLSYPAMLGFNAMTLLLIGAVVNEYHNAVSKKILSSIFFIFLINFLYYLLYLFFSFVTLNFTVGILLRSLFLIFYNTIISVFILAILLFFKVMKISLEI